MAKKTRRKSLERGVLSGLQMGREVRLTMKTKVELMR